MGQMQNFAKIQACLNLGPKMPYLGILKNYCRILNQQTQICQIGKFCKKNKDS